MYNFHNEHNYKSLEKSTPINLKNNDSRSKHSSYKKEDNLKNKEYDEDIKLIGKEVSAKKNMMNNFHSSQKNFSIFNM